jgi:hypothetical protein
MEPAGHYRASGDSPSDQTPDYSIRGSDLNPEERTSGYYLNVSSGLQPWIPKLERQSSVRSGQKPGVKRSEPLVKHDPI